MQDDERYEEEAQYDEETGGDEEAAEETQEEDRDAEADDTGDSDGAEHDGGGEEDPTDDDASEYGEESDESEGGDDDSDDGAEHDGGGEEDPTDDAASEESDGGDSDTGAEAESEADGEDRDDNFTHVPSDSPRRRGDSRSGGQPGSGHTRAAPGSSSAASSSSAPPPRAHPGVDQLYADVAQRRRLARFAFSSDTHDSVLFMWAALAYHQRPTQDRGQFILDWFLQPTRQVWPLNVSRAVEAELPRVSAHAHSADANAFTPFVGAARNDIQLDVLDRFFTDKKPPQDPAHGKYAREYKQFVAAARKAGFTLHELGLD